MPSIGWYYRLSEYFKNTFGERVYKIPLHVGMSCPNRDGTLSDKGCIFCYNPGFSPAVSGECASNSSFDSVSNQILNYQFRMECKNAFRRPGKITGFSPGRKGNADSESKVKCKTENNKNECNKDYRVYTKHLGEFYPAGKYLAYFQSYTNTYGSADYLEKIYMEALSLPGVVGMSVATRPDCLSEDVINLLKCLAQEHYIWLELGLQSSHNRTLDLINRGHDYSCFVDAVERLTGIGIMVSTHVINGLPGETVVEMLLTVERLSKMPIQGIKFHHLQVVKNTPLVNLYEQGKVNLFSVEDYLNVICDQLEILPSTIVIHRLMGEVYRDELLIAPRWDVFRGTFASMVENELRNRNSYQGKNQR